MNKGLELIEAHHLFDLDYDRLEVVVHPQSMIHAMVRLDDGSVLAHCGPPDMRVPIGYALRHPAPPPPGEPMDLVGRRLDFDAPDEAAFPCLALARAAGPRGRHGAGRAERGQRGGRRGLPGRAHRLHGHPPRRWPTPSGSSRRPGRYPGIRARRRRARPRRGAPGRSKERPHSRREHPLAGPDPDGARARARGRPHGRRQVVRDAGRALLHLLRAPDRLVHAGRDRVRRSAGCRSAAT